ncbi:MAG: hypothetical protein U0263_39240 [Polyangiaceae bacterium]
MKAPIAQRAALAAIDLLFETALEHGLELERVVNYDEPAERRPQGLVRAFAGQAKNPKPT